MRTVARDLASIDNLHMKILFIASVSIITRDPKISSRLFVDALGLPLQQDKESDYIYSEKIEGSKHFGVWPLSDAAQACFGRKDWPTDRPIPKRALNLKSKTPRAWRVLQLNLNRRDMCFSMLHARSHGSKSSPACKRRMGQ